MDNKIYKKNGNLVIEIPLKTQRSNFYDPDFHDEMDNIIGVIANNEIGFCYQICMDYCGKAPQWTDFFYKWFGKEEDFKKLCEKLDIDIFKYLVCSECGGVLYGSHTVGDKGNLCFECKEKNKIDK